MWIQKVPKQPTFPIVIKKYDQVLKTTKKPKVPKSTKMLQKEEKKEQIAIITHQPSQTPGNKKPRILFKYSPGIVSQFLGVQSKPEIFG